MTMMMMMMTMMTNILRDASSTPAV